jgi:hypothetical protein
LILCQFEDAGIEVEPAEVAVDEVVLSVLHPPRFNLLGEQEVIDGGLFP